MPGRWADDLAYCVGVTERITGRAYTERAERYAKQLAGHLAHKVAVEHRDGEEHVDLDGAHARLWPTPAAVEIEVAGADRAPLFRAMAVIEEHLVRFGVRDALAVEWDDDEIATAYRRHVDSRGSV